MKIFVLALSLIGFATAQAAVKPIYQDIKLPTQKVIEYQAFVDLAAASSVAILSDAQGPTSGAALVLSSGFTNPDYPRTIKVTPGGMPADVAACVVTVAGTDLLNNAISETFTFQNNYFAGVEGSKAFKTVTSMSFAASCEDSPYNAHWNIGVGESIGLKRCMNNAGWVLHSTLNGAKEGSGPTVAANASAVYGNTADFAGTMNGSNDFEVFFMQNFRCK